MTTERVGDEVKWSSRERITNNDLLIAGRNNELLNELLGKFLGLGSWTSASVGFGGVFSGLSVTESAVPDFNVLIHPGMGLVYNPGFGINGRSDYRLVNHDSAPIPVSIGAPPGADARIDLIEIQAGAWDAETEMRDIFDVPTKTFVPANVAKRVRSILDAAQNGVNGLPMIKVKQGVVDPAPVAPTVDANYIVLAQVLVEAGAPSYANAKITDRRRTLVPWTDAKVSAVCGAATGAITRKKATGLVDLTFDSKVGSVYTYALSGFKLTTPVNNVIAHATIHDSALDGMVTVSTEEVDDKIVVRTWNNAGGAADRGFILTVEHDGFVGAF